MSQTKIKFYFEAKHQDSSLLLDNIKRKPMEVSTQPPLSLSKFSKITCCESVSNYTSYSNVAKTLSNSELQHLVKSVFVPCKTYSFPKNLNGRSNFIELLHFHVKAGDKVFEDHFKHHQRNASYISQTRHHKITSDSSNKEQLSLVIRFVDSKFNIREEFISFLHCTNGVTGEGLFDILLKSISDFSLDIMNCRGQSYDGAGAMAGHTKGLSSRILNLNEKASFVHCYSHRLNLAICASCNVQYVKNLLTHVKEVSYFFNLSPTRQQKLEEHIESTIPSAVKKKFKDVCRTRWVEKVSGLDTFQELFIPLVFCLEEMSLNVNKSFNHSTSSSASSLLKLITGFNFIVAMCITRNVFDLTLPITRMLQSKSNDIYDGLNLIQALKDVVSSLRNVVNQHHQMCYEQALKIAQNINVAETKPRTSFISKNRNNTPSESISDYFKFVITIPLLDHLSVELDT
ncbi:52 kDa repressor of the inhibitor of the protein kinase-like [Hydra vulgaris]|uniref:52 kDa repressor of the inhibitor of the protein kinase-like n=1 Tax=Hydra vulgaris TaxID=6087 RepID=A0ABM4B0M4_HYDVU